MRKSLKSLLALFAASAVLFTSCSKESESVDLVGAATVKISLGGVTSETPGLEKLASVRPGASSAPSANQVINVPFSDGITLMASVSPVGAASSPKFRASSATLPVPDGTAYEIGVFTTSGAYVSKAAGVYTASTVIEFGDLVAGTEYQFLAVAGANAHGAIKEGDLATQTVKATDNLMWRLTSKTLVAGDNAIEFILRNLFTEINVSLVTATVGQATAIGATTITPSAASATVNLGTGVASEYATETAPKAITMVAEGANWKSGAPVVILTAGTTVGKLVLNGVTIGGVTKNLTLSDLVLNPGTKYNLNLTLVRGSSVGGFVWAPGNLVYNNGVYGFAANQGEQGHVFSYASLIPNIRNVEKGQVNGTNPAGPGAGSAAGDPCLEVLPKGTWRSPNLHTYLKKIAHQYKPEGGNMVVTGNVTTFGGVGNNGAVTTYMTPTGAVQGTYFGTNQQPSQADQDKFLFLPFPTTGVTYWGYVRDGKDYEGNRPGISIAHWQNQAEYGYNHTELKPIRCVAEVQP